MIPAGAAAGAALLVMIGLLVVYPRVGRAMIRDKGARLAAKLGRDVRLGAVEVTLGHAVIHDVELRGPLDGDVPLVHIDRVEVELDTLRSLVGSVRIGEVWLDGLTVTVRRDSDGRDNVRDIVDRLRGDGGDGRDGGGSRSGYLPEAVRVSRIKLLADDAQTGATALIADGDARWKLGEIAAEVRGVTATSTAAPRASVGKLAVRKLTGRPPVITIAGGEVALWPKLALSGIAGSVIANPGRPGEYVIDLAGGYGGVPGNLWTARGGLDTRAMTASVDLEAAKFQLDRLAQLLDRSPVVDYKSTSVDTKLHLDLERNGGRFSGSFHLSGLNVGHPMLADKDVHDLDLSGKIAGSFDRTARRFELTQGDLVVRDLPLSVTGVVARPPRTGSLEVAGARPVRYGPGGVQLLAMRVVIPPIDCQRVLSAIPTEMAPYLSGYKLRGVFDADIHVDIDWADLDATKLDGHVGLKHCRVVDQPADSPKRLVDEFEHYVEVEKGEWTSFVVGPENESFVPLEDISPYLIKSIISTEDSGFYHHHGFIPSEFRTALINNLKAGAFRHGASSITMQLVKNVLLYREKTLARKLQELFLTWHLENTLTKDRILEIYFNVIEYGPNLYGIGPAAESYFGKVPKNLTAVEAAFFSTILPSPKERYKQYCAGTLTKWTEDKIRRILALMLKRERLTQAEYDEAAATPLLFAKDGTETEEECLRRTRKIIKNSRSTNPLKR